uniref:Putative lipoyltransferase 2, mitochondrial n=1 Tax=Panagrolaimus sp. ES5 TaxID=591445 RepID=A0AC34FTK6_9BILA
MSSVIKALWFGRLPYLSGLSIQEKLFEKLNNNKHQGIFNNHYICLFEHNPVYTVGLRGHLYSKAEEDKLRGLGADFVRIKRGGMITFHGPGQLVAYPLCNLNHLKLHLTDDVINTSVGVKTFVNCVEEIIIQLLTNDYNISSVGRTEDTGVWVESQRKIAAIGIQVRHGITSHGFALNCNTDLRWFDNIIPCGIEGKESTSISKELSKDISVECVLPHLCSRLESVFNCKVEFMNCVKDSDKMIFC